MLRLIITTFCALMVSGQAADKQPPASQPAESQPASRPSESRTILRRPVQADVLRKLLGEREQPKPVLPEQGTGGKEGVGPDGQPLLLEGTVIVERPGRLEREDDRAKFVFNLEGSGAAERSMHVVPSQLLETMEREADAGFTEFIVSGEVTRYRGENFLLLRKVLRRTGNGNLSP